MKGNTRIITTITIFGALYALSVIFLAPISFEIYQVRVADALLPLSMIFGLPSAIGFGIGAIVANVFGGLGLIDIIGGATANVLACSIAWYVSTRGKRLFRFIGSLLETIVITLVVGGYLSILFAVPVEFGLFGVLVGSIIAINIIGFPIEEIIRNNEIVKREYSTSK